MPQFARVAGLEPAPLVPFCATVVAGRGVEPLFPKSAALGS